MDAVHWLVLARGSVRRRKLKDGEKGVKKTNELEYTFFSLTGKQIIYGLKHPSKARKVGPDL